MITVRVFHWMCGFFCRFLKTSILFFFKPTIFHEFVWKQKIYLYLCRVNYNITTIKMNTMTKEEISISISCEIAQAIQRNYRKEDYSLMVENFFKSMLPAKRKSSAFSTRLRGCAAQCNFVDKSDKDIQKMMYQEKYGIWQKFFSTPMWF